MNALTRPIALPLTTPDGAQVVSRWFPAPAPVGVVVLAGAVAVPQAFYTRFANHLTTRGLSVLTTDYRGVGDSRPPDLRGFRATLRSWGEDDLAAALDAAERRAHGLPLLWLGHSFGGQALALAPVYGRIAGAVTVASGFVHRHHWPASRRWMYQALLGTIGPVAGRQHGFVPGWLGLGADLPTGVVEEWGRWCLSERYLLDHVPGAGDALADLNVPVRLYAIDGDSYTPPAAVDVLAARLPRADTTLLRAETFGLRRLDHFDAFRQASRPVWDLLADDLLALVR